MLQKGTRSTLKLCIFRVIFFLL